MIQINNLSYRYSAKKTLFNGLNLTLQPGKVYGLLGKNGAGKSSLIKNIAGILFPTQGSCVVNGKAPKDRHTSFLENMFFIPEECELPALYVKDFIALYSAFYPSFNKEQFSEYLAIFNVSDDSHLKRLSFGQKKKAYIAFAIATNTSLLIMDEPTNGLDIPSKLQFRNIVANTDRSNKITIISTHQVRDLDDLISSIIIIDNSELVLFADKEEVNNQLYFSIDEAVNKSSLIYQEQTPQGLVSICSNDLARSSYLDLEILFNATLSNRDKITRLFERKNAIG